MDNNEYIMCAAIKLADEPRIMNTTNTESKLTPISADEFAVKVIDHILGEGWQVTDPLSKEQILAIALDDIIKKLKNISNMKLCNPQLSRDLQALGYDGEVTRWYNRNGELKTTHIVDDDLPAPRLDDAAYFLRDRYGVEIVVEYMIGDGWQYYIAFNYKSHPQLIYSIGTDSYESALEAAVTEAIEIIKDNKP